MTENKMRSSQKILAISIIALASAGCSYKVADDRSIVTPREITMKEAMDAGQCFNWLGDYKIVSDEEADKIRGSPRQTDSNKRTLAKPGLYH